MRNFLQSKMASSVSTRWTWDGEITQSSCKGDTKSRSHPGMKLGPVRVFPCKHSLTLLTIKRYNGGYATVRKGHMDYFTSKNLSTLIAPVLIRTNI